MVENVVVVAVVAEGNFVEAKKIETILDVLDLSGLVALVDLMELYELVLEFELADQVAVDN